MLKASVVVPFNRQTITERRVISRFAVYVSVYLKSRVILSSFFFKTIMPSTKSYCQGNLWLKARNSDAMEAVISDFRDLLQVNQKERVEDVLNCDERSSVDGIESEISFRAFMCPTADPFRKSNSSSSSYGMLMELLEQGNLIKEAVRRLKTSPGRNKQLKRLDRCR